MGFISTLLISLGFTKKKCNILLVGLDNSGKTTIVNQMKAERTLNSETAPTVGFNLEQFTKNRICFTVFDMSGQGRYRDLWQHYFSDSDGVIFVVDSSDTLRICVARDELENMLDHDTIKARKIPFLFLANKNDLPSGMSPSEISDALGLEKIKDRNWHIR